MAQAVETCFEKKPFPPKKKIMLLLKEMYIQNLNINVHSSIIHMHKKGK
jgi:hypothetical protein